MFYNFANKTENNVFLISETMRELYHGKYEEVKDTIAQYPYLTQGQSAKKFWLRFENPVVSHLGDILRKWLLRLRPAISDSCYGT